MFPKTTPIEAAKSDLSTMGLHRCEGIVLKSVPFGERKQVVTLFSLEEGVIKLMVQWFRRGDRAAGVELLTRAEFVYRKGQSELYTCREVAILTRHLDLRESLELVNAACSMAKSIVHTQQLHCPAPKLYQLFCCYLAKLSSASIAPALLTSFRLKLLCHEGLLPPLLQCVTCRELLKRCYLQDNESFCQRHTPPGALYFDECELAIVKQLAFSRSLSELVELRLTEALQSKIELLFTYSCAMQI